MKKITALFMLVSFLSLPIAHGKLLEEALGQLQWSLDALKTQLQQQAPTPLLYVYTQEIKKPIPLSTQIPLELIQRKDFFDDIVNMSEKEFRKTYRWSNEDLTTRPEINGRLNKPPQIQNWINEYPRRIAIFNGKFRYRTIEQLEQKAKKCHPENQSHFAIRIHDPALDALTDIRYLQSLPENKFAAFQLASTFFGPLEGGMILFKNSLGPIESEGRFGMLHSPVQGEEASVSATGAAIYRKYFMPTFRIKKNNAAYGYFYLLHELRKKLPIDKKVGFAPRIQLKAAQKYQYNRQDIPKVGIGIHKDAVVTSGYGILTHPKKREDNRFDYQVRLPVDVNADGSLTDETQVVTQILTAAYNFGKNQPNRNQESLARMLLEAAYRGTIDAAYVTLCRQPKTQKNNKLFLTLVGGGAFKNPISSIGQAIKKRQKDIMNDGLDVTLIYRPDTRRTNQHDEATFLKDMVTMVNAINTTHIAIDDLINRYIDAVYSNNKEAESELAQKINDILDTHYREKADDARNYVAAIKYAKPHKQHFPQEGEGKGEWIETPLESEGTWVPDPTPGKRSRRR